MAFEHLKTYSFDTLWVGIDPGLTGYITALDSSGSLVEVVKTPINEDVKKIKKRTGKKAGQVVTKTKNTLDEPGVVTILQRFRDKAQRVVVGLEIQHAMHGQGLASTAKNMEGFGFWKGVVRGLGLELNLFRAVDWQKVLLQGLGEDTKKASCDAVKVWKDIDLRKTNRSRVDDHNMADSVNIARYTYMRFGPQN